MSSHPSALDPVLRHAPHRIETVTLVVHDLDRVACFYRDMVGLRVLRTDGVRVALGAGSRVLLELIADKTARMRSPHEPGLFHTAFLLPDRVDLGAWLRHASQHGLRLQGASDHLVSEAVYLADPEGNGIEIYADRPPSAWTRKGHQIEMTTDPLDAEGLMKAGGAREWGGFPDGGMVGHVHLQVGSIETADAFFGDYLGFDLTCRYPGASFYGSGGYHHQLAGNVWNSRGLSVKDEPSTGLADITIAVTHGVLDAVCARASDGTTVNPARSLALRDPWGLSITLLSR